MMSKLHDGVDLSSVKAKQDTSLTNRKSTSQETIWNDGKDNRSVLK